jgi:metal-responsive CopG/Arc/MetJ family transcriptional regulator
MSQVQTSLSLKESFVQEIDQARGTVPRSVMIQNLADRGLEALRKEKEAAGDHQK